MRIGEIVHIPVIALINLGFIYFWSLKIRKKPLTGRAAWASAMFGAFFSTWGLDVMQRDFVSEGLLQAIRVSVGCWLVFVLAINLKYKAIYGWSRKDFWLDYGGDLLGFILVGILLYLAT